MKILKVKTKERDIGNIGEKAAIKFLKKRGYKILERNYVALGYEIDVIAKTKDTVVFAEIKTRTSGKENPCEPRPASSVTADKQRKIISCAKFFLGGFFENLKVRFDIIEVYLDAENQKKTLNIEHLESAFNYNTAHPRKNM